MSCKLKIRSLSFEVVNKVLSNNALSILNLINLKACRLSLLFT